MGFLFNVNFVCKPCFIIMDKIHNKAHKLIDDVRKKKNKMAKTFNKNPSKISAGCIPDLQYKCCMYCQKVFVNSKFLMKHLLRRHSDELVLFYKNFTNREFGNTSDELHYLIAILRKEISSLKKGLQFTKPAVERKQETDSIEEEEIINVSKISQNTNSDIVSIEIGDLKNKMFDVEKDIQKLNEKFIQFDIIFKNEVMKKQDITEKMFLSEEKIMQAQESQFVELRQVLLNDLKSLLNNQQKEISSEWKSQLLELKNEIKRLDYAIENVQQQAVYTDSIKDEIKKELIPHCISHINGKKCGKKKLKDSLSKTKLFVNKSYYKLQQRQVSSQKNLNHKESISKNVKNYSKITHETDNELSALVTDKLSQFSIPNTFKIPDTEFIKILKLLEFEKECLFKKYDTFNEMYDIINTIADQKAHTKLKAKQSHKITFAEPLTSTGNSLNRPSFKKNSEISPSVQSENNQQFACASENPVTCDKIISAFPDKGASGDSVHHLSNKQNTKFNSIKEFETSRPIDNIQNSAYLKTSFAKHNSTVNAQKIKCYRKSNSVASLAQSKLYSTLNKPSIQFKEVPVCKTSDKISEFRDCFKSEIDFDDASSLESCKPSDEDETQTALCL